LDVLRGTRLVRWSAWTAAFRRHPELVPLARVLLVVLFVRYFLMPAIGFLASVTFPPAEAAAFTVYGEPNVFWDMFARYDSGWYYAIARDGYRYLEGEPSSLAFFPLYPLAMRGLGSLLGGEQHHYYMAGMLISRAAFLAALVIFFYLARLDLDDDGAERAVLYMAIFPFSFFFSRVYSESLFLLLTLAAFYLFRTRRWELGGLAGGLAALTRVNGILSLAALACIVVRDRAAARSHLVRAGLAIVVVAAAFSTFSAYAYTVSGSPFGWMRAIESWGYEPGGAPWMPLIAISRQLVRRPYEFLTLEPNGPYDVLNGMMAGAFVIAIPFVWRRFGAMYGVQMLVNLWVPLSSGHVVGLGRYCAVLFPFHLWLASFQSPLVRDVVVVTSVALHVLCMSLFVNLHPLF
jgi:hypothetical protein